MTSARRPELASRWLPAALLGAYAAVVALAPDRTAGLVLATPLAAIPLLWWTALSPVRWVTLFFAAALLLPPLPLPLGGAGPHPAVLFAGLGILAGLLRMAEWRIRPDPVVRAFLLFFGVLLASVSLAALYSGAAVAAGSGVRVLLLGISLYMLLYSAYGPSGDSTAYFSQARTLHGIALGSALFACLDFYFQFPVPAGFSEQFVWLQSGVYRRAQGVFYEASTLGNFCAFFLVMTALGLLRPRAQAPVSRPVLLAGGAVFSVALIFSYSRASVFNLGVAVAVMLYLERSRIRFRRAVTTAAACIATGAAASYVLFPAFGELYWVRLSASVVNFFSETGGILSGRLESWRAIGEFLMERPWHALLGVGYKTLPYSEVLGRPVIADNMYLSLLVETGLIGVAAMALFCGAILVAAYRAARAPEPCASFFGTWIFCFWVGQLVQMMSGDLLTYWRVLPVYFWVLGVAVRENARAARR